MPDTREGYVLDAPYTWSFFDFQSPVLMSYIARLNRFEPPSIDEPFTYCELGCGNGVTTNLLAASLPQGDFYGVDFNPEHITNGELIASAGKLQNMTFVESDFSGLDSDQLPRCDFISLHGVYSWVSEPIRQQVWAVIDAFLNPGGLVYVSYNTLPGWADLMPIWKLMHTYTANLETDSLSKAEAGLEYLEFLRKQNARYFRQNPAAGKYLDKMLDRNIAYVAHEFCNDHFHPMYFCDVADHMAKLGLVYAGSAKVINNHSEKIISGRFLEHLESSTGRTERQSRLSLIRNEFFRRDIYFKGRDIAADGGNDRLLDDCIPGSVVEAGHVKRRSDAGRHGIGYQGPLYDDLIRLSAAGSRSVKEICDQPEFASLDRQDVLAALNNLLAGGDFQMFASRAASNVSPSGDRYRIVADINRAMLNERLPVDGKCYVCSPVLGSAIRLSFKRGLALLAVDAVGLGGADGHMEAAFAKTSRWWPEHLRHDGKSKDRKVWIDKELSYFETHWLPRLLRLGVIES